MATSKTVAVKPYMVYIGILAVILLVYIAGRRKKRNEKIEFRTGVDQSTVRPGFNPAVMALELKNILHWYVFASTAAKVFEKALALSTGETQLVYNYYNEQFAGDNDTLLTDIRGQFFLPDAGEKFVLKLEALNLV